VLLSHQEIEQQIENLSHSMPRLLKDNHASEFWIEFLERADAIKDHVPLSRRDWVTEKIHGVLARYGIAPPSRWIAGIAPKNGRVYAFPSGLRLN
jgi:hypothetical protein